jgi:hypothetical protein
MADKSEHGQAHAEAHGKAHDHARAAKAAGMACQTCTCYRDFMCHLDPVAVPKNYLDYCSHYTAGDPPAAPDVPA